MEITIKVQKETYEMGQGIYKIIQAAKQASADGWQPGQDVPAILMTVVAELVPMVGDMDKIPAEYKEDKAAFLKSMAVPMSDMAALFMTS